MSIRSFFRRQNLLKFRHEQTAVRAAKPIKRRSQTPSALFAEPLERRATPALVITDAANFLVSANAADNVTLGVNSVTGKITVNGADQLTNASAVTNITVTAVGNFSNVINLSGVTVPGAFTSLGAINVDGGAGNDSLIGSELADTLNGGAGNDYIYGLSGADVINGGTGYNTLFGGTEDDTITGGGLSDTIDGGAGVDVINGGAGADLIYGGTEGDQIDGGTGNDTIYGGSGPNQIHGGTGNDYIQTLGGQDLIYGDTGNDTINSGAGLDTINVQDGFFGNDSVLSGAGDDLTYADPNDIVDGGAGQDSLQVDGTAGADIFAVTAPSLVTFGIEYMTVNGNGGDDTITVDTANDPTIQVSLDGGGGYDTLTLTGGNSLNLDIINGADGNDTITGSIYGEKIYGGAGNDVIHAGAGDDSIYGEAGTDVIYGEDGNDLIQARDGAGGDSIDGGNGADNIYADNGDSVVGGAGIDTLEVYSTRVGELFRITPIGATTPVSGVEQITVLGSTGDDKIIVDTTSDPTILVSLYGGGGNDTITASGGPETIDGGDGLDLITSGNYGDSINGGGADDTIYSNGGDDTVDGGDGRDSIIGGDGGDSLYGGTGGWDDTLIGGLGNDQLDGGIGDDTLIGGSGDDSMYGSAGNDVFQLPEGNDYVSDSSGNDKLDFSASLYGITIDLDSTNVQAVDVAGDTVQLQGQFESFLGSNFDDTITLSLLATARTVDGNPQASNPPGDTMIVDPHCQDIVDTGGAGTQGIISSAGFGSVTYYSIETKDVIKPTISIGDVAMDEGDNGTTDFVFTLTMDMACPAGNITVDYSTADGSATLADSDYNFATGTVTFGPGQTEQTITVTVNGDTTFETDENFFVNLSNVDIHAILGNSQAVGTIQNDDPVPDITIDDVANAEGQSGITPFIFTVSLSNASYQTITVVAATQNDTATAPSDFTALSPTIVTFLPGQTTQTVTVNVKGDTTVESDEDFFVNLSNPNANVGPAPTISFGQGVGTILNDDTVISIDSISALEGNVGTTDFVFTVSLSNVNGVSTFVNWTAANGTATAGEDYVAAGGVLTFAPGETEQQVTVTVNGDTKFETNETFSVILTNPTNGTLGNGVGTGTIINDDAVPTISINDIVETEGNVGTKNFTFTVTLSNASYLQVTTAYATADGTATAGSDYTSTAGVLTFSTGQTSKTFSVTVSGDYVTEADETFFVNLTNPNNASLADGQGVGTILNDDTDGVTLTALTPLVTTEAGGQAIVSVVLSRQPTANVTFNLTSSDTTEGTISAASLTFTSVNWNIAQTVTITGVDDFVHDGDVPYSLVTTSVVSADITFNGFNPSDVSLINRDDDLIVGQYFTDFIGDKVTVSLKGNGSIITTLHDPNGSGTGPLQVSLAGTDVNSVLTISTKKVGLGSGFVAVGIIQSDGSLKSINAKTANLVEAGINLGGSLGALTIHDVINGADIIAQGVPTLSTSITAHTISDGTTFNLGSAISSFTAARFGQGSIIAPSIGKLSILGDARNRISGDFGANITLSSLGVAVGSNSLTAMTIKGLFHDGLISVLNGSIGKISLHSVNTAHGGVQFGVTAKAIQSIADSATGFHVTNGVAPLDQFEGDFHVKLV